MIDKLTFLLLHERFKTLKFDKLNVKINNNNRVLTAFSSNSRCRRIISRVCTSFLS